MPDKIEAAATALQEYAKTKDIGAIERAVDSLEEFDIWSIKPDERLTERRRLLLNWSRVLHAIDGIKGPGFDPEANPTSKYPPPPPGYPSSVTPQSVSDPAARARYEAAIVENEKKRAQRRTQMLAVSLEERAFQAAHRAAERLYTTSVADQSELDAVFQQAGLGEAGRKQVRGTGPH
jgi:hypothetical protein